MIGFLGHKKIAPILQLFLTYNLLPICKLFWTDELVFINQTNKFSLTYFNSWLPWPHQELILIVFDHSFGSNFCKDWLYELITDNVWSYSHKRLLPILQFFTRTGLLTVSQCRWASIEWDLFNLPQNSCYPGSPCSNIREQLFHLR